MDESKFREAQNLINQISYLENCIEDLSRKDAKICVSWKECIQRITYNGNITNEGDNYIINESDKDVSVVIAVN
jgi:hypothetical protein